MQAGSGPPPLNLPATCQLPLSLNLSPTAWPRLPLPAADFSVYRLLRHWLPGAAPDPAAAAAAPPSLWQAVADAGSAIVCGGLAGMAMWAAILPLVSGGAALPGLSGCGSCRGRSAGGCRPAQHTVYPSWLHQPPCHARCLAAPPPWLQDVAKT